MLIQNEHGYKHFADGCIPTDASLSGASSYAFSSQVGRVKLRALIFSAGRNALTGLYMQVFKKGNTEVYDYVLRIGVYRKNSTHTKLKEEYGFGNSNGFLLYHAFINKNY